MLVLTGLLRFVLKMPDDARVRAHPAGRRADDVRCRTMLLRVARLPAGASRPAAPTSARCRRASACRTCSSSSFVIMLPITLKTGDPIKGWEAGLDLGVRPELRADGRAASSRPIIRKITPRAALLGTLAGVSIAFISMRPALEMFMTPVIGVVCFAIILASWFGGVQLLQGHSGRPGRDRRRHADRLGLDARSALSYRRHERRQALGALFANFGFSVPLPAVGHVFARLRVPRRHPGHRDPVRHLRPGRGDGQRRERRGRRRQLSRPRAC